MSTETLPCVLLPVAPRLHLLLPRVLLIEVLAHTYEAAPGPGAARLRWRGSMLAWLQFAAPAARHRGHSAILRRLGDAAGGAYALLLFSAPKLLEIAPDQLRWRRGGMPAGCAVTGAGECPLLIPDPLLLERALPAD
ncbi:MAG: hypothetical protein SV108_11095 [Pseudomonadota bacterium]|nr:hypothetical protein [Pseudomonadota bacterium]